MNESKNIEWIDTLKALAIIGVVVAHVSMVTVFTYVNVNDLYSWTGNILDSSARFSVPIFVMITGVLFLPRDFDLNSFFKKRLIRVFIPFVIWTIIYMAYNAFMSAKDGNAIHWQWIGNQITHGSAYHLWYIYMLIGLYFVIPILSRWVQHCNEKEIFWFLVIWFSTFFFDTSYSNYQIKIDLHNFSGFIGYLVLGYYLSRQTFNIKRLNLIAGLFIFMGVSLTAIGSYFIMKWQHKFSEYFYDFFTINVLMTSVGIFILIKHNNILYKGIWGKLQMFLARNSYGIYLAHVLVLEAFSHVTIRLGFISPFISIPVEILLCLVITGYIIKMLNLLPWGKYITG